MSDDGSGGGGDEGNAETEPSPVVRYSTIADDLDAIFDVLSDPRRRYLLYHFLRADDAVVELDAAADAVCAYEAAETDDRPPRENVSIDLHHVHLPRLENAGIVDYDRRRGRVRFTGAPSVEEFIEHTRYKEFE